jgi:hypothetical protein
VKGALPTLKKHKEKDERRQSSHRTAHHNKP